VSLEFWFGMDELCLAIDRGYGCRIEQEWSNCGEVGGCTAAYAKNVNILKSSSDCIMHLLRQASPLPLHTEAAIIGML
jgi:hypothetical protein